MSSHRWAPRSALAAALIVLGAAGTGLATTTAHVSHEAMTASAVPLLSPAAQAAAVADALARLPASARPASGVHVVRDVTPCPSDGLPADDRLWDDRGWLHLCASDEQPATVAAHVAAAVLFEWAPLAAWADLPAWRRLNRWVASVGSLGRAVPENQAREAFVAPAGMRSPRWDLATFAAAAFLDQGSGDERVACQLMSQATFLRDRLTATGIVVPASAAGPACAAFERWAAMDRLAAVELILAAPSTAMLGSLFGHVLLRIVYRDDGGETPPYLSRTLAFLADNERPLNDDPGYALKGIFGFYEASLHDRPFLDTFREYVVEEGRDLRRWRLELDARETRALLERLWTAMGRTRYTYYFFRRNCATLLLDLIDEARPPGTEVARPGLVAAPPSSTLEAWAGARSSSGGPLLMFVPEPILSFQSEARRASIGRRAREDRIEAAWTATASSGEVTVAVAEALRAAHAQDPAVREAAYVRLGPLLASAPPEARADAAAWLRASVAIESHLSAVANQEAAMEANRDRRRRLRASVEALAGALAAPPNAEALRQIVVALRREDPEQRLVAYRVLATLAPTLDAPTAARARRLAVLSSELEYDVTRMNAVPALRDRLVFVESDKPVDEQAYMVGFEDLVRFPEVTRVAPALRAVLRAQAAAREAGTLAPEVDDATAAPPDSDEPPGRADLARAYQAERSRSGIDQLAVLAAVTTSIGRGASPSAGVMLAGALYDEELGGHRRFGFASDTGFVVARNRVLLSVAADGDVRVPFYDTRIVGYRALRPTVPEAGGSTRMGWELYLDTWGDRTRAITNETKLGWGLLAPLMAREALADHGLLAFGLAARTRDSGIVGRRRGYAIGAPLALEWRASLGRTDHRSWAAARLWVEPLVATGSALPSTSLETGVNAEAHLALAAHAESGRHDPALIIRVEGTRASVSGDVAAARSFAPVLTTLLSAGIELR